MIPYEYHPEAASELEEAAQFYDLRAPGLGREFADEVDLGVSKIREHPHSGRRLSGDLRAKVLRRFPYSLIYSLEPDLVFIVAAAHQSRRPGYWLHRLK